MYSERNRHHIAQHEDWHLAIRRSVVQIYELTLHYTQHRDHNVVTGALELLQQIFRTPPIELLHVLTAAGGIPHVSVCRDEAQGRSIVELIDKHCADV